MNTKDINKRTAKVMIVLSLITGAVGGLMLSGGQVSAQSPVATPTVPVVFPNPSSGDSNTNSPHIGGTFHSNENADHEAKESPAREAQENAGQFPTVK